MADYIYCDVRKPITLPAGVSTSPVVNLAAVHRTPGHPDHEYYDTNLSGAENITAYCTRIGADTLVFTSSISVYGPTEDLVDEASATHPESAYGKSKLQAEAIHLAWQGAAPGRRLITIRPAVVFGPYEGGNFTRLAKKLRSRLFVYPGRKDTIKACGYVGDLTRAIDFALQLPDERVLFNFAYPDRFTIEQICEAFHQAAHFPRPPFMVPKPAMMGLAMVFEALARAGLETGINRARVTKLVKSTNVYPGFLVSRGFGYAFSLTEALRDWSLKTDFREQVSNTPAPERAT